MAATGPGGVKRIARREARMEVAWKAACEKAAEIEQQLQPPLARVYERVHADPTEIGKRFDATLRDLSVTGAFLEGEPLPLLSRVVMRIEVPEFRTVEAVGWVMWRRKAACTITGARGVQTRLGAGFGVLFEWLPLDARLEIARRVAAQSA